MILTAEQQQQLITKAMKDETFRAALLSDARATIAQELQVTIAPGDTIHVLLQGANEMYQVIPEYPADWPPGLSVEAMEQRLTAGSGPLEATQQTVAHGQARLLAKAWHDASFKQALLHNPKAVVEREFGAPLPAEVTLKVVAEDARTQYLVLPPALNDLELSDEQLEQVAGGEVVLVYITTLVTAAVGGSLAAGIVGAKAGW